MATVSEINKTQKDVILDLSKNDSCFELPSLKNAIMKLTIFREPLDGL